MLGSRTGQFIFQRWFLGEEVSGGANVLQSNAGPCITLGRLQSVPVERRNLGPSSADGGRAPRQPTPPVSIVYWFRRLVRTAVRLTSFPTRADRAAHAQCQINGRMDGRGYRVLFTWCSRVPQVSQPALTRLLLINSSALPALSASTTDHN